MRKRIVAGAMALLCSTLPSTAFAWGFAGHRYIMRNAIELLPPELKPFFTARRDEIVNRVIDPDLWRNAGWEDDPNHFVDFGVPELGAYPFAGLPRDYGAAIEKFGTAGRLKSSAICAAGWRASRASRRMPSPTPCCSPRSPATTSRMRTSHYTPRTTSTDS
jgi:hypothetical protein